MAWGKLRRHRAVFGIYADSIGLKSAVEMLRSAGFRETDISALVPENPGSKDFAATRRSKAPEGALAGYILGAFIGAFCGAGAAWYSGASGFYAALIVLAGLGLLGAVGAAAGALKGATLPEYEAKRYEGRLRSGGILVSVHCDDRGWEEKAREMLLATGARGVSAAFEQRADYAESDKPVARGREGIELRLEAYRRRRRAKG
jgi:hypothetical protein